MPAKATSCTACGSRLDLHAVGRDELDEGTLVGGRYRIERSLAAGGMGRVYLARQEPLGTPVCVKTLHTGAHADPAFAARFEREAKTTSQLRHPNIVSVFDFGTEADGTMFLVMEYVEGTPLSRLVPRGQTLPAERAVRLLSQVCDALAFAHERGVVHRDLKPANIMVVALPDGSEHVKVLDFGSALMLEGGEEAERLTRVGTVIGTPAYMAPEYILGRGVDARVDVYAVGVLLYALLTGATPFRGDTQSVFAQQVSVAPEPPRRRNPQADCSEVLERVVMRTLVKDPAKRFATALELKEAMQRALAGDADAAGEVVYEQSAVVEVAREERAVAALTLRAAGRVDREQVEHIRQLVGSFGGSRAPRPRSEERRAEMRFVFGLDREVPEAMADAVRCAAKLAELGEGKLLRVGLHDAQASCRGRFDEPGFEWRPFGPGWDKASTLAAHATPGAVLLSGPVARYVPADVTLAPVSPPEAFGAPVFAVEDPTGRRRAAGFSLPFVGRTEEQRDLLSFAVEARSGSVLLLRGPEGIGKSCLLRRLAGQSRNIEVLWQVVPAVRRPVLGPDHPVGRLATLGWSVPGSGASTTERFAVDLMLGRLDRLGDDLSGERRQLRLVSAAIDGVVRRARHEPLVVVFDDLQHADAMTWQLVSRLVTAAENVEVSVVLALRDEQPIPFSLPEQTRTLRLGPLSLRQLREALAERESLQAVPQEALGAAILQSRGIPRVLEEVLRDLMTGRLDPEWLLRRSEETVDPYELLEERITRRIEELSAEARRTLAAAAVLGTTPARERVAQVLGLEEQGSQALPGLDELRQLGLLATDASERLAFPYDRIVRVAWRAVPASTRAVLHRRAAEGLEASAEARWRLDEVGRHWLGAGEPERALAVLRRAAAHAREDGDLSRTAETLRLALEAWEQLPEEARETALRARLSRDHGLTLLQSGQLEDAERVLREAFPWAKEAGEAALAADLLRLHGKVLCQRGELRAGVGELESALAFAEKRGIVSVVADTCGDLAEQAEQSGDLKRAEQLLQRGLQLVQGRQDREAVTVRVHLYNRLGRIQARRGDAADAAASFSQALELAEKLGDRYQVAGLLGNLGGAFAQRGELDKALRFTERALHAAEAVGDPIGLARQSFNMALIRLQLGQHKEAHRLLHASREAARRAGWKEGIAMSEAAAARLQQQEPR